MSKHQSKEAFFQRLQQLAEVKKPLVKESRNLGTLIDYKRAADGIAYGIIKEQHHYYIKKAGTKENPNVSDFAYIGGLANITEYQYDKLSQADKHRNIILHDINEAFSLKPDKNGSKRKRLNEDKAGEEIEKADQKASELDAATAAEAEPEVPAGDGGEAEMAAGLEAEPKGEEPAAAPEGGEEIPAEMPAPEGGEEVPAEEPAPEGGEEVPAEEPAPEGGEGEAAPEGGEEEEAETQLQKEVGKLASDIKDADLDVPESKWLLKTFIQAFKPSEGEEDASKDKMSKIDINDRQEIADLILKVVSPEDIEGVASTVPQNDEVPAGIEEVCAECGGFGAYAESRGYTKESLMECGAEELGNVVSGYANAYNDGQNDGDFKLVALLVNPEVLGKLKDEYGHEDYSEKLTPYVNQLGECKLEERQAQIDELWGGLKSAFGKVGGDIKAGAQKAGQAVGGAIQKGAQAVKGAAQKAGQAVAGAAQKGAQAVGQYATGVKQAYHAGEVPNEVKKLTNDAMALGKQIAALNTRLQKAGQQPVNVNSILTTIKNQLGGAAGAVDLSKYGVAKEGVMSDMANVPTQPDMLKEDDEPEEKPDIETPEVNDVEDTKDGAMGAGALGFAPEQSLGGGVVKPDGAGVEIEVTPDKTVKIEMSESEKKLRKYVRERLEIKAGLKKESLNEGKKSETLKKLDKVIDEQFKLYETAFKKKVNEGVEEGLGDSILKGMSKIGQMGTGKIKLQRQLKSVFPTLAPNEYTKWLQNLYAVDTMYNKGLERYISAATDENKQEILQQIVNDEYGVGDLAMQNGRLVYIPAMKAKE